MEVLQAILLAISSVYICRASLSRTEQIASADVRMHQVWSNESSKFTKNIFFSF